MIRSHLSAARWALMVLAVAVALLAWTPVASAAADGFAPPQLDPPTWADEFDGTSLDLTRWSHRATGPRHDGILTPDAVSVGNGLLTIKTYTEGGSHYSGMISSHRHGSNGFEQTYGYFEARMKFDSSPGQWSAFWLQSPTIGGPLGDPATAGVEMDIAEHRARCVAAPSPGVCAAGSDISDRIQQALIWDGYGADSKAAVNLSRPLVGLGTSGWHTWGLRWTPTELTFYYDDVAIWSATGPISRRSEYIILSSEVGEFFAGALPAAGYGSRAASTTSMQVDYVRAWELPSPAVNTAAPAAAVPPALGNAPGMDSTSPLGNVLAIPVAPPPPREAPAPIAPPADRTPPNARLSGSASQKLGTTVAVTIACPEEDCRATTTATIRVPRHGRARARTYALKAATTTIARSTPATVRLKLSSGARGAMTRALRAGKQVVVALGVRVADGAGNARPLARRVALRL
jgi:beta-glucanase (GH16 family)